MDRREMSDVILSRFRWYRDMSVITEDILEVAKVETKLLSDQDLKELYLLVMDNEGEDIKFVHKQ